MAAKHRAEAARIRTAEAQACHGLSEEALMASPVERSDEIVAVRELPDYGRTGKASSQRGGATVLLKSEVGMSPEDFQRMLTCDAAQARTVGGKKLERTPWAVAGASSAVVETDQGMLVEITANDRDAAKEIVRRAQALQAPTTK